MGGVRVWFLHSSSLHLPDIAYVHLIALDDELVTEERIPSGETN